MGRSSEELLTVSTSAFVFAVETYHNSTRPAQQAFSDYAVLMIDAELAGLMPTYAIEPISTAQGRPLRQVEDYIIAFYRTKQQDQEHRKALRGFPTKLREVLPLLTLGSYPKIAKGLGPQATTESIEQAVKRARARLGCKTNPGLALEMHSRGLKYHVPRPPAPLVRLLTNREMDIAALLSLPYSDISALMHTVPDLLKGNLTYMRQKTGARSNVELALMVRIFDTGDRRDEKLSPAKVALAKRLGLTSFRNVDIDQLYGAVDPPITPHVRSIIDLKYGEGLEWKEVGRRFNIREATARNMADRAIRAMRNTETVKQLREGSQ